MTDRAQELFARFRREGVPMTGTVLLVLSSDTCPESQSSMRATSHAETVGPRNMPVRWANLRDEESRYKVADLQGITYRGEQSYVGNRELGGYTPTVLLVRDGRILEILGTPGQRFTQRQLETWAARAEARTAELSPNAAPAEMTEPTALAHNGVERAAGLTREG